MEEEEKVWEKAQALSMRELQRRCESGQGTVAELEALTAAVRAAGLISPNEELDDVATGNLELVMVEAWLGRALMGTSERDPTKRHAVIARAKALLEVFLERCVALGIRRRADDGGVAAKRSGPPTREERVARFKVQKTLKDAISGLERTVAAASAGADEGVRRELAVKRIELACTEAEDDVATAEKELEILSFAAATEPAELARLRDERLRRQTEPGSADVTRLSADLEVKRETYRDGVFRPYHNLPTMSLEEFAESEMRQLAEREARAKDAPRPVLSLNELSEQGLEDDTEATEAAVLKARKWDDWKDGVPKGSGVTKRV